MHWESSRFAFTLPLILSAHPHLSLTHSSDQVFRFVSIQAPEELKDRELRRSIRSHAVKHALQNKRRNENASDHHFRFPLSNTDRPLYGQKATRATALFSSPLSTTLGVFRSPSEDGDASLSRLKSLLRSGESIYIRHRDSYSVPYTRATQTRQRKLLNRCLALEMMLLFRISNRCFGQV